MARTIETNGSRRLMNHDHRRQRRPMGNAVVDGVVFKREVRAFGECLGMHRR